jgi:hypothetical protein
MFPLSAPTDSLYKFISLFGLAIFILASYKSGKAFEASSVNKVQAEALKKEIRLAMAHGTADSTGTITIVPVEQLPDDLDAILQRITASGLPLGAKLEFEGEIKKLKAQKDGLGIRIIEYIATLVAGVILIALGFILWYKRDQLLKDRLLKVDLEKKMIKHKEEMMMPRIPVI